MSATLVARAAEGVFNGLFLGQLIAFGVVTILFLFYFNRLLGIVLSAVINTYAWPFYHASVKIQSVQISPLGGRIFLKGVRYRGENEAIYAHDGYITWRYWLRRVAEAEATEKPSARQHGLDSPDLSGKEGADGVKTSRAATENRPCRITVDLRGLEWYVYNRKPAYDSVLATLVEKPGLRADGHVEKCGEDANGLKQNASAGAENLSQHVFGKNNDRETPSSSASVSSRGGAGEVVQRPTLPKFLRLLPIGLTCSRAAMVMGNEHTRCVLVIKCKGIDGRIDARLARPYDQYRQCFDFDATEANAYFRQNQDYREDQLATGARLRRERQEGTSHNAETSWLGAIRLNLHHARATFFGLLPFPRCSSASIATEDGHLGRKDPKSLSPSSDRQYHWTGLSRYLLDDSNVEVAQEHWRAIEYARTETIADIPKLQMSLFWDVPGRVAELLEDVREEARKGSVDRVTGEPSPAYGLEINICGGTINYGPWADRQRANLQSVFFPASYAQTRPQEPLSPGALRISTCFNIRIVLDEEVVLRIPTRETSKDARWKAQLEKMPTSTTLNHGKARGRNKKGAKAVLNPEIRSAGWIEIALARNTCVGYEMDMVAGLNGYRNAVQVDARSVRVTSSVNHDLFLRTSALITTCDLSNPLVWNSLHAWDFKIQSPDLELFMLRDHAFLITDLVNDWTSSPSPTFFEFIPFVYNLNLDLPNFKLYLNVNDANIVNSSTSVDDNAFLILGGETLEAFIKIPSQRFQPTRNKVAFDVKTAQLGLHLSAPLWTTQRTFLQDNKVASLDSLNLQGSYDYCFLTSPALTDTLLLDLDGSIPCVHLYGFLVRYFMNFKDNYFGDDLHFQTQEEFQRKLELTEQDESHSESLLTEDRPSNDLDVILTVTAHDASFLLPSQLYTADQHIKADIAMASIDLRFTNYYMDMHADFSPLSISHQVLTMTGNGSGSEDGVQIFIDGATVGGHRLFGLPPSEPTYVCNWDFAVGQVLGECNLSLLSGMVGAMKSFVFGFADSENALRRAIVPILHDVIFLRATVQPVKIWLHISDAALMLSLDGTKVSFNDRADQSHSERLQVLVPRLVIACVDAHHASRSRSRHKHEVPTQAYIETSINVRLLESKPEFQKAKGLQQKHIALHDSRTQRTPWLLEDITARKELPAKVISQLKPPAMPFPPMPDPLTTLRTELNDGRSYSDLSSSHSDRPNFDKMSSTRAHPIAKTQDRYLLSDGIGLGIANDVWNFDTRIEGNPSPDRRRLWNSDDQQPAAITSFSAYNAPYFPLLAVAPGTEEVPELFGEPMNDQNFMIHDEEQTKVSHDHNSKHVTLSVDFGKGIRALLTPQAISSIALLVSGLASEEPPSIIDEIQIDVVGEEESTHQTRQLRIIQLRLELPLARLRFLDCPQAEDSISQQSSSYDFYLEHLCVTAQDRLTSMSMTSCQTLHLELKGLECVALSKENVPSIRASVSFNVSKVIAWAMNDTSAYGHVSVEDVKIASPNRDTSGLARLVSETVRLATQTANLLSSVTEERKLQIASLVRNLTVCPKQIPEASFITTTSFVLRTASFHPRNTDAWKLVCRLRWLWQSLTPEEQKGLFQLQSIKDVESLLEARQNILTAFLRWRGWDLVEPGKSSFMRKIFGIDASDQTQPSIPRHSSLDLSVNLGRLSVTIYPEGSNNEFALEAFRAVLSRTLAADPHRMQHPSMQKWTAQFHTGESSLSVDWDIIEILEGVQKGLARHGVPTTGDTFESSTADVNRKSNPQQFHVVVGADHFQASVKTLNIETLCVTTHLASSACVRMMGTNITSLEAIIHTEALESKVRSKDDQVLNCTLTRPTIHLSQEVKGVSETQQTSWRAGGLCQKIEISIEQDLLSLIGIMDRILSEEVYHLMRLKMIRPQQSPQPVSMFVSASAPVNIQFHLGLILDSYTISTTLLSSLRYILDGEAARSTGQYSSHPRPNVLVDFDLGSQGHTFVNLERDQTHEIAHLDLPPLNGQISGSRWDKTTSVRVSLALEQIVLDASSIHALFSTYTRQELLAFRQDVSRDMQVLRSNLKSLGLNNKDTSKTKTRMLPVRQDAENAFVYKAGFSLAGVKVKARTGQSSIYSARLTLDLGCVYLRLNNEHPGGGILALPEMAAKLQMIRIVLKRSDGEQRYRCGDFSIAGSFLGTTKLNENNVPIRSYEVVTTDLDINIYPETASTIVDIIGYLQQRFKSFDFSAELSTLTVRARRMRSKSRTSALMRVEGAAERSKQNLPNTLFSSMYSLEMNYIQASWHVGGSTPMSPSYEVEDLIFSLTKVKLATQKTNSGRLILENLQLQMAPRTQPKRGRSRNSALLPEVAFNVAYLSTDEDRRLAFQAVGKALDLRLTSQSLVSAANLTKSIGLATRDLRKVIADWNASFVREEQYHKNVLGNKTLSSVLIVAEFAGGSVHIQGKDAAHNPFALSPSQQQAAESNLPKVNTSSRTVDLQAPGIALKLEYKNLGPEDPSLSVETRIDASSNVLHPAVVPLFLEMSESLKEVVGEEKGETTTPQTPSKATESDVLANADPAAILGRTRLNLGLRISKQQFGLTCQPIARVEANAQFDDIYVTVSTVQAPDQSRFFALTASIIALQCSLQHVYSREATGHFSIERIDLSLINSKHVSNANGLSAILKISPMSLHINAKQMHDFFLFGEIWIPSEIGGEHSPSAGKDSHEGVFGVQRYQQVAATGAFPWNASITITKLDISVDLGQALGKTAFSISNLWVSSKKNSDWEQNLCLGFDRVSVSGIGRMSGTIELQAFRLRTSIHWPEIMQTTDHTPLVEASMAFEGLSAKLAFDYQAVLLVEFSALDFLMYNVRDPSHASGDRLTCFVNGDKVHVFCTTQSSAQCLALYQAVTRLIQEKRAAYDSSLKDVEKFMQRRTSSSQANLVTLSALKSPEKSKQMDLIPRQLQTNVVITLKAIKAGAYPRTFFDPQIFKIEALDAGTRFSIRTENGKLRSGLGMSLGQVRVALSNLTRRVERKAFEDILVADVVEWSTSSRGGTILKVPRLIAEMQTWQLPSSSHIDYIFKSAFEGKVEVGWNYSRISYIRGMWGSHARSLAQRLGRPLPQSALQISGGLPPVTNEPEDASPGDSTRGETADKSAAKKGQSGDKSKEEDPAKITAVVNVPLSRYDYTALEPPVIVTPQLRDMGEATPPLEWIGLQRERLPHLTHQVVIVPLLEVAKEVEDAYVRILGGS